MLLRLPLLLLLVPYCTTEQEQGELEEQEGQEGGMEEAGGLEELVPRRLPPGYCDLGKPEYTAKVRYIRKGFQKRLYTEEASGNLAGGSEVCDCQEEARLHCTTLEEVPPDMCHTEATYYSHLAPFYLAHRGSCICFSGEFICAREDFSKGTKPGEVPVPPEPLVGVFLYLGFSRKDASLIRTARETMAEQEALPEEEVEVTATVQQAVSHFTSNLNKSDCTITMVEKSSENYILSATLDEFLDLRMKKQMADWMLWQEKGECFEAVQSIATRIHEEDADMRSHVVMSIFLVASAEANVPPEPQLSSALRQEAGPVLVLVLLAIGHLVLAI